MSADSPKIKPTRSSLRQSLNLASVGKALGFAPDASRSDAGKDLKNTKKTKETASRRNSSLHMLPAQPAPPRNSMGDSKPPSQRTATPEAKPATRRRVSASHSRPAAGSSDEQSAAPSNKTAEAISPQPVTLSGKVSTLRPRSANATSASALPKYRPKSVFVEHSAKPPSPALVRTSTRRRLSTSDDEKKESQNRPVIAVTSPAEKSERPISPLPHRAALKANLTNSLNVSPHSSPTKPKFPTPASAKTSSPSRPNKIVKTSAAVSRPPSSSSSSAPSQAPVPRSSTPKGSTPKTSGLKAKLGLSGRSGTVTPSNGKHSPLSRDTPSPLAHRTRPGSTKSMASSSDGTSASASASGVGNMSHISEANSEDEDDEDVELLLAPVAVLGAPTPAMPRIQPGRKRLVPQTPTRVNLPTRAEMSYTSPFPVPSAGNSTSSTNQNHTPASTSSLRLRVPPRAANEKAMRGSIMSWEQLANETSVTLGEDEFGRMLSDIPAPFRSGAASPSLSSQVSLGPSASGFASTPGSPLLLSTGLDSPGGYGSISQVLLPDVTPSPAPYMHSASARFSLSPDASAQDASSATMLRLQLAAAEHAARERLAQVQALEEELHELTRASARQAEEAAAQVAYMEAQWRAGESRARPRAAAELDARLHEMRITHDGELKDAVARAWNDAESLCARAIEQEKHRGAVHAAARVAESSWGAVRSSCDAELDVVRDDRAVLALLLGQLDQLACAF